MKVFLLRDLLIKLVNKDKYFYSFKGKKPAISVFTKALEIYHKLRAKNFAKDTPIMVATDDSYLFLASLLAIWSLGGKVCMPNGFAKDAIISAGNFALWVITDEKEVINLFNKEIGGDFTVITIDDEEPDNLSIIGDFNVDKLNFASLEEKELFLHDLAKNLSALNEPTKIFSITQMTSGTTGTPKLVTRFLDLLILEAQIILGEISKEFTCSNEVLALATVPIFHAYGLEIRFILPLLANMPLFKEMITYEEQLQKLASLMPKTFLVSSPAFLKRVSLGNIFTQDNITITAGGAISSQALKKVHNAFGNLLFEILGSTETGVMAIRFTKDITSLWHAPKGVKFFIKPLDNEQDKVNGGCKEENYVLKNGLGTLIVASPYIEDNFNTTFLTLEGTSVQAFLGEDIVDLKDNTLKLFGRSGRVIKIEDNRVSLDHLEEQIRKHPFIKDCALIPLNLENRQYLQGMLVLTQKGNEHYNRLGLGKFIIELRSMLKDYLLPICIPRKILLVSSLPLNATGKVDYKEIQRNMVK